MIIGELLEMLLLSLRSLYILSDKTMPEKQNDKATKILSEVDLSDKVHVFYSRTNNIQ